MTTLRKYIQDLQKFAERNPELISKHVGYMTDDEGNGFVANVYSPSTIYYDKEAQETLTQEDLDAYKADGESVKGFKKYVVIN